MILMKFVSKVVILNKIKKTWRPTKRVPRPTRGPRPTG